jgi:hypothetical protein
MAHTFLPLPWYEVWFPLNAGTMPAWALFFLWSIGVCWWFARPFMRPLLLHLGYFLMMLFCAAIGWSLVHGIAWSEGATWLIETRGLGPGRNPDEAIVLATAQTGGLLLLFTVIVVTSAILFLANLELSSTSFRSTSDDSPPEDQD